MMKDNASVQKKTGRKIPFVAWLGYLLVVTLVVTGVTFSGYVSKSTGDDVARLAKFDVSENFEGVYTVELTGMYPGLEKDMELVVTNNSEVAVGCYMTLKTTGNLPVEYYGVYGDKEVLIPLEEKTLFATLPPLAAEESLKLRVRWPNGADTVWDAETYMYLADAITFTLITEQVD